MSAPASTPDQTAATGEARAGAGPPKLSRLALVSLCRDWRPTVVLDGLPLDLAKLVWTHVNSIQFNYIPTPGKR